MVDCNSEWQASTYQDHTVSPMGDHSPRWRVEDEHGIQVCSCGTNMCLAIYIADLHNTNLTSLQPIIAGDDHV